MKYISHRGNINGPNPDRENDPIYIFEALAQGYDVEIDVWVTNNSMVMLGHDSPMHSVNKKMLQIPGLWCHAKNIEALNFMLEEKVPNCFWHQGDDYAITSQGYLWTYPGKKPYPNSICIGDPAFYSKQSIYGICSDEIGEFRND